MAMAALMQQRMTLGGPPDAGAYAQQEANLAAAYASCGGMVFGDYATQYSGSHALTQHVSGAQACAPHLFASRASQAGSSGSLNNSGWHDSHQVRLGGMNAEVGAAECNRHVVY